MISSNFQTVVIRMYYVLTVLEARVQDQALDGCILVRALCQVAHAIFSLYLHMMQRRASSLGSLF